MNFHIRPSILVVCLFSLVFTAGFFLLIYPQLSPIGKDLTRLDSYNHIVQSTTKPATNDAALTSESALVQGLLPAENQLYDLSVEIEALATNSSVTITALNLSPSTSTAPATTSAAATAGQKTLPASVQKSLISVSASGTYQNLQSFSEGLTKLQRYIDIQDLNMAGVLGSTQALVTITAVTYNLPNASQ